MKLFKTELDGISTGHYGGTNMKYALCQKPDKGRFIKRLCAYQGCREGLTGQMRSILGNKQRRKLIDSKRTRLLIYSRIDLPTPNIPPVSLKNPKLTKYAKNLIIKRRKERLEEIMLGLQLVNHFEERHGWLKTKLYSVDSGGDDSLFIYMVSGSPRWQKTPHYLSLYVLLIRAGVRGFAIKEKAVLGTTLKEKESLEDAMKRYAIHGGGHLPAILQQLNKVNLIMAKQDNILETTDMSKLYPQSRYPGSTGQNEGIKMWLYGNTYDWKLSSSLEALCKKAKIDYSINNNNVRKKLQTLKKGK